MLIPNFYNEKFTPTVIMSDCNNQAKPSFLLDCFQVIAGKHSILLDSGREAMLNNHGAYWVLSRISVNIKRFPKVFEECEFLSYPLPIKSVFCERDYIVKDKFGEVICNASSVWVVLDQKTHSIKNCKMIGLNQPEEHFAQKSSVDISKISLPDISEMNKVFAFIVKGSSLDENFHVNNAKYADFMIDALSVEEYQKHSIKSFKISFLSQTIENDEITLYRKTEKNGVLIAGYKSDMTPSFSAYLEWENY